MVVSVNNSRRNKINIANEIRHLMFSTGGTFTGAETAFGISREGLANTLDQLSKYILCCLITSDYLTVLYLGLIGTAAEYMITE